MRQKTAAQRQKRRAIQNEKLYCIITETLTKEDITNDLLHTEFNFFYGDATPVAPHVITENEYIYKVSQIVVGNEATTILIIL